MSCDPEEQFARCPTCRQYSHSIGEGRITEAFMHFQSMISHPVRGHPMGDAFDEKTRDAAQVLVAEIERLTARKVVGPSREQAKEALRRWHRDTCYPDAADFELDIGIDAILALLETKAVEGEGK